MVILFPWEHYIVGYCTISVCFIKDIDLCCFPSDMLCEN